MLAARPTGLTLLLVVALSARLAADSQPNVLFIAVDDLNDWVGCLGGHPQTLTPHIDELAQRGMLFTNAHCAAPACTPSRASLFTGQMPQNTQVWSNKGARLPRVRPDAFLLPHSFSKSGYRTLGTGKLGPTNKCFQTYFDVHQRWSPLTAETAEYTPAELPSKGTSNPKHTVTLRGKRYVLPLNRMPSDRTPNDPKGESFDWGPFDVPDSEFGDTQITDWAIDRLKTESDRPLFLAVGYYRPHQPLWAPKRFFERFKKTPAELPNVRSDDLSDLGETAKQWALKPVTSGTHATVVKFRQWQAAVEAYLACVSYVDHEIGRLIAALDQSPLADNTLIVLWSDHGWHLGEKEHWGKWTGWERSSRVPLIVVPARSRQQRMAPKGSRCDQPVNLIDIYPTLVELCGVEDPPHQMDGQSLVPLLQKPLRNLGRTSVTMFGPGNASLRTDRWRFIHYSDGSEELYDLRDDPNEWTNLAGQGSQRANLNSLQAILVPYLKESGKR
jgi:arylsulfatase A-like enzyme